MSARAVVLAEACQKATAEAARMANRLVNELDRTDGGVDDVDRASALRDELENAQARIDRLAVDLDEGHESEKQR